MALLRNLGAIALLSAGLTMAVPALADLSSVDKAIAAKNYDAAIAELQSLVANGDAYAKWKLAQLYLAGRGGSAAEGISLLNEAAEAGEPEAQARLGVLYAKGEGVKQSDSEAYKWLSLATRGAGPGVSRVMAETNLAVVSQRMTTAQRDEALAQSDQAATAYQAPVSTAASVSSAPATAVPAQPQSTPAQAQEQAASLPQAETPSGIFLQLAAVANEADINGEWQRLKRRLGDIIEGQELQIERADLGSKGVFYRLQIGPFPDRNEAASICTNIKAGGGDCLIAEH